MRITLFFVALVLGCLGNLKADLIFNPTFTNGGGQTWDATMTGVVNQAITDWQNVFSGVGGVSQTIDFTVTFSQAGNSYLGQWSVIGGGLNRLPWSASLSHTISFNADYFDGTNGTSNQLWFDPTPLTSGDQPFSDWDALSVARHEIGHMLGFTGFYSVGGVDPWDSRISSNQFNLNGTNIAMNPGDSAHLAQSLNMLMSPALLNSVRLDISTTEAQMLSLAYGYDLVAVPEPHVFLVSSLASFTLLTRRRSSRQLTS